jgi:putative ABC transport system substrate-binding protein
MTTRRGVQLQTAMRVAMIAASFVLLFAPLAAEAQPAKLQPAERVWRIGYLGGGSRERIAHLVDALESGLRDLGYVEGRNAVFEHRFADGRLEHLPDLAAEMVRIQLDVIVASNPQIVAVKQATTTIPIVMVSVPDPVDRGLIASLARPGGNITGLSLTATTELWGKRLQLLREISPRVSRVAALWAPSVPGRAADLQRTEEAARQLRLTLLPVPVRDADDIENALGVMAKARAEALIVVGADSFTFNGRQVITARAARLRLPAIYPLREFVEEGGLLSYDASLREQFRRAATYVDKILKGAKPADLPVEQPTKFELLVSLKAAKALGLTIPQSILLQAGEVMQ